MKNQVSLLFLLFTMLCSQLYGQGKFFGGNGASSYTGTEFLIGVLLPVELIAFDAHQVENKVIVYWTIASEKDNNFFEIQKMTSDKFVTLGTVKGAGTTSVESQYSFADNYPTEGINYYRIRQVDYDGKEDFSHLVSVVFMAGELMLFPNPTSGEFYLNKQLDHAHISLYDHKGIKIKSYLSSKSFDITSFPDGLYFLKIDLGVRQIHFRVIKQSDL